eukprot:353102-Chlamydomonas_euryale.AAC.7
MDVPLRAPSGGTCPAGLLEHQDGACAPHGDACAHAAAARGAQHIQRGALLPHPPHCAARRQGVHSGV